MTGEPHEGRERHDARDPVPPIVAMGTASDRPDAALTGAALPPYRSGLHPSRLVDEPDGRASGWGEPPADRASGDVSPAALWGGSWEAPSEEAEREAVETWDARRAAWDAGMLTPPADEAATIDGTPLGLLAAPPPAEVEPGAGEPVAKVAFGEESVAAGTEDETGFDVGPSGAEDIAGAESPWSESEEQDETPLEDERPLAPAGWNDSWTGAGVPGALDLPEAAEEQPGAGAEAQAPEGVDEWLVGGVVDDFPWDALTAEPPPVGTTSEPEEEPAWENGARAGVDASAADRPAWDEEAGAPAGVEASATDRPAWDEEDGAPAGVDGSAVELPAWETWQSEDDRVTPPSDEDAPAWGIDAAGDEEFGVAVEIESVEVTQSIADSPDALEASAEPAGTDAAPEPPPDELVARVPPTPLDSWFHSEQAAGAAETWEAFGKALEEAASWGDLGATIATGMSPGERESAPAEPAPMAAPESTVPAASASPATMSPSEAALDDLAGRLEMLARRLRQEGEKGVEHALSEGDRLEASLAGFIAGYVAARRG